METAVFGGGCFWCIEAIFQRLKGVKSVESGYSGGTVENPTYEEVCTGNTGHAEVIKIIFDPNIISYHTILEMFFDMHDPTTLNRQGNDIGKQYRSVIFYTNENQKQEALSIINKLNKLGKFSKPIVTQIEPLKTFYKAESYHQDYYNQNQNKPYCSLIISPKIKHITEKYKEFLKDANN